MDKLLLEIGTEEIPAGYIQPALEALSAELLRQLDRARIDHGKAATYATPRRLAVTVEAVAPKQRSVTEEISGPPEKVAFDAQGQPTMAAVKFAEKVGLPLKRLRVEETARGRYLVARKTQRGLASRTLLKEILPRAILSIPFPKTMIWGELHVRFARPIHTLVALLGKSLISFELGNIRSGRTTAGHFFMHPSRIKLADADSYVEALGAVDVMVDIDSRREAVREGVARAATGMGGKVLPDDDLLDIVTNLVELPFPTAGRFDDEFLELPDEVLITAMREHQKYFAVADEKGGLLPGFIAVNNTRARDMGLVARGHERVIRARLADAKFFYRADLQEKLDERCERLRGVLFHAKLGTVYEKVQRVRRIAVFLARQTAAGAGVSEETLAAHADRASWLSKSDLVSQMVGEFPKLQGVMGRIYADKAGEPPEVAVAIEEHYRPTYSGGALPGTLTGAICSIADKIDSICGFFSVGLVPTGGADPYALRRQGIGLVQIMRDRGFSFSLAELIRQALAGFDIADNGDRERLAAQVATFLERRMARMLAEEGFSRDVIAAVLAVSADDVPNAWQRVAVLEKLKAEPDFEPLAVSFKRVVNIIRKSGQELADAVDEGIFQDPVESGLYGAFRETDQQVSSLLSRGEFQAALAAIASLRDRVDAFFDAVMVMADDATLRTNRLALLGKIAGLFARFADFSKIST
jgi:glycyl-tRNA synthetase beta chain